MLASEAPVIKEKDNKKVKEAKAYKTKIKRHKDAVITLYSKEGIEGEFLTSASSDQTVRSKYLIALSCFLIIILHYSLES